MNSKKKSQSKGTDWLQLEFSSRPHDVYQQDYKKIQFSHSILHFLKR